MNKMYPGMWRFPTNPDLCCVYRVPNCLRKVNPEAYTPQLVLIGPLRLSLKSQALKSLGLGDITYTKSMGYLNMEEHKKIYLAEFTQRVEGEKTIDGFRRIIEEDEEIIRASYSESTAWIQSPEFVDMVLHDSVFIIEFILRDTVIGPKRTGDPLIDEQCLVHTVKDDLILLENQLPYFILEKLFDLITPIISLYQTFQELIITYFGFQSKIGKESTFRHFTDLIRCVRVETLPMHGVGKCKPIEHMYNADKLDSGGVKFEAVEEEFSLYVRFENDCLKMPLTVDDQLEMTLRNIMALEQCHYPFDAHVCNFVFFLDYLVDNDKDVDLLVEKVTPFILDLCWSICVCIDCFVVVLVLKGIIKNWIVRPGLVAEMVNKLGLGILEVGSYYSDIAIEVNAHYSNPVNRSCAVLKRVYFGNVWTGTATIAATFLLVMTLTQTVASIIQVTQNVS